MSTLPLKSHIKRHPYMVFSLHRTWLLTYHCPVQPVEPRLFCWFLARSRVYLYRAQRSLSFRPAWLREPSILSVRILSILSCQWLLGMCDVSLTKQVSLPHHSLRSTAALGLTPESRGSQEHSLLTSSFLGIWSKSYWYKVHCSTSCQDGSWRLLYRAVFRCQLYRRTSEEES
jgi:hypothetical protein